MSFSDNAPKPATAIPAPPFAIRGESSVYALPSSLVPISARLFSSSILDNASAMAKNFLSGDKPAI